MAEKSVITIATNKKVFVDMACTLAMSFLLWNDTASIKFFLITDLPQFIPQKLKDKIDVVEVSPNELGEGFSTKLHMDQFAYTKQTLFIDADCLVYASLETVFDRFKGHHLSAIGYNRYEGENIGFCKDIALVRDRTAISYFPLLCGSLYYFEKGETLKNIFDYARSLLHSYHKIGLISLRDKENEEPLLAIAMAKFNQQPVNDTGLIKADRMFYKFLDANVIEGRARLWNNAEIPMPEYSKLKLALPAIVHFNGYYAELFEYGSEAIRLKKKFLKNKSIAVANSYATILSVLPGQSIQTLKNLLRPLYRLILGHRKIKSLKRM
jgi:hypothetical protein